MSESSASSRIKRLVNTYSGLVLMGAVGIPIGVIVGAICALFGRVLLAIGAFRNSHVALLLPFLALAGLAIVFAYRTRGKGTDRGMSLVFDVGHGTRGRHLPAFGAAHYAEHVGHASLWRQRGTRGVAVQIGATVSHCPADVYLSENPATRFCLSAWPCPALPDSSERPSPPRSLRSRCWSPDAWNTARCFPRLRLRLPPSMTSGALGLEKFEVAITASYALDLPGLGRLALLGIAFGMVGGSFCLVPCPCQDPCSAAAPQPLHTRCRYGLSLSAILFVLWQGRYCGLGTNLISAALNGDGKVAIMPWDWALKFTLTIATLAAGYQGGEVTPLFSIGASLGVVLAGILGMPVELCAALGYAAVFGSATNTLLAPIFIGCEVFGFSSLPTFFIVCVVAYLFNMDKSIYALQEPQPTR